MNESLLTVTNLSIVFDRKKTVVDRINFQINRGETFALVGESGSGKSMTAMAVFRLLPGNARLSADAIHLGVDDLLAKTEYEMCQIRGRRIALIFQEPMSSLNPVMTIERQIGEVLDKHYQLSRKAKRLRILELLQLVEIKEPERRSKEYPHQLSGGQRQRVMIAIALAGEPDLLIADEPTTALDVTIQAQILKLLQSIQQQTGMALWLISHDLALVSNMADTVAVMQKGRIVEYESNRSLFSNPKHPYTKQLIQSSPDMDSCFGRELNASHIPLMEVSDFKVYYPIRTGILKKITGFVKAVDGVSFSIEKGKTLALVGESGCGKTTLGKALLNLLPAYDGQVHIEGVALHSLEGEALRRKRSEIQIVFQDPFSAMNPRMLVGEIISEGVKALHPKIGSAEIQEKIVTLLKQVDLPADSIYRYPHEFSGGQRQRICIARALAVEPKLIICDEPTSALDVSVQAQIIELLKELQNAQGISYLFITHDLAVVSEIADDIAVMYEGKILEHGNVQQVLDKPKHNYTRELLAAVPKMHSYS